MNTVYWFLVALVLMAVFIAYKSIERHRARRVTFEPIDPNDPDDPMRDPAVQAMMREVIRTGRPMHMNRGEAPTFVGDPPKPEDP